MSVWGIVEQGSCGGDIGWILAIERDLKDAV